MRKLALLTDLSNTEEWVGIGGSLIMGTLAFFALLALYRRLDLAKETESRNPRVFWLSMPPKAK